MIQWHPLQWGLWPMVAVAMAVFLVNCLVVVDVFTTIPSSALVAAAKTSLPPSPLTTASIINNSYCRHQQLPSPLPYS
jgi:hypothetical protein